jgi:sugar phosphate isomerase/epimerase
MQTQRTRLVLANMSVSGATPIELIDAAAAGGFDSISLRLVAPTPAHPLVPVMGDEELLCQIERRLANTGVEVLDVGGVWLHPDLDVDSYVPAFETAARLGAKHFLMGGNDPNEARLIDNFARFCELSRPFGLKALVEFIPYLETRTVDNAFRLVSTAAQPNGGILVDALHLSRSGGTPEQLISLDPKWLSYCQLCDARAEPPPAEGLANEARSDRLLPGLGALPLTELLDALPAGIPIGVEAPCAEYAELSACERGRLCGVATRVFLNAYRRRTRGLLHRAGRA